MASSSTDLQWRPAAAEMIAVFFFVFVGAGTVVVTGNMTGGSLDGGRLLAIAFAHVLAIALLVAATAHLSGGHINPAVTFAAVITRRLSLAQGAMHIGGQPIGAILGVLTLAWVLPEALGGGLANGAGTLGSHAIGAGVEQWQAVIIEGILTAVLVFVVFATAMDRRGVGAVAPLVIGLAVLVDHLVGVPLTGASMNPARTLGPALAANAWADQWVYWVGPLAGGAVAAGVYHYIFRTDQS